MEKFKTIIFIGVLFLLSCQPEKHEPYFPGEKPDPISDYKVENLPGGASITCKIDNDNILYVKAEYSPKKGLTREAKASKYDNVLMVNGFPESKDYTVKVYAVGISEEESAPVEVSIHPKTPPYLHTKQNLEIKAAFGGGIITTDNPTKDNLVIGIITTNDSTGEWEDVTQEYTKSKDIEFAIRGFEPKERKFGMYVRDQWLNYSDTVYQTITPWEEEKIDFSNWQPTPLPSDAADNGVRLTSHIFDGIRGNWKDGFYSDYVGVPQHITIKLPGVYVLSRFKLWQSMENPYGSSNPKKMRIWGTMEQNPHDALDNTWYVLGVFDNYKPSGLPVDENSEEDIKEGNEGNEFIFPTDQAQPALYLRFETLETWQPRDRVYITELAFWGSEQ